MKTLINYLYYRIATLFYNEEGDDSSRALTLISFLETIIIVSPLNYLIKVVINANEKENHYLLIFIVTFFVFMIPLTIFNYLKFRGAYQALKSEFEKLNKSKKQAYDIIIVLLIILISIYFFLLTRSLGR